LCNQTDRPLVASFAAAANPGPDGSTLSLKSILAMFIVRFRPLAAVAALLLAGSAALAQSYTFTVVASGLSKPTGIAARGGSTIYFTEIPTPGVGGGLNAVKELKLGNGAIRTIHQGEPEPRNIVVDRDGVLYWTCKSAGVILEQSPHEPASSAVPLLTGLAKPSGIAIDKRGRVYFTQIPTPGVAGGANSVSVVNTCDHTVVTLLHSGEPEPVDIAASDEGELYWTCRTAGVILTRDEHGQIKPLLTGLDKPVGIALDDNREMLFWTEVPTPGVSGANGGRNKIWSYDLKRKIKTLVHSGDPEPTDIAVASNGRLYWTCTSAGVIVEARRN
jgi:streptogramin lyase